MDYKIKLDGKTVVAILCRTESQHDDGTARTLSGFVDGKRVHFDRTAIIGVAR